MSAASRLVSTLFHGAPMENSAHFGTPCIETSLDAADTSVRATVHVAD
jgi:hypothetical protein